METLHKQDPQEEIVREYLDAFTQGDVNGMLRNIHPAIHYERYIGDQPETIDNGAESFRSFLSRSAAGMDEQSLELLRIKAEPDQVTIDFRIITSTPAYQPADKPMKGNAVFWFMEGQILQMVVWLKPEAA
jgi:hypothetical protein